MEIPKVLIPRLPVPAIDLPLLGGGRLPEAVSEATTFFMLVFYRGLHCPVCAKYLLELERAHDDFALRGVVPIAISSDTEARTQAMTQKIHAAKLRFAYGLPLSTAREWGLTISKSRGKTSIGIEEPPLFSEPGLFFVRPDRTLYWGTAQTMPFARPHFDEILVALDFVVANDYPARGEYLGPV